VVVRDSTKTLQRGIKGLVLVLPLPVEKVNEERGWKRLAKGRLGVPWSSGGELLVLLRPGRKSTQLYGAVL